MPWSSECIVPENADYGYDDVTFKSFTADTFLFREIEGKKRDIVMVQEHFQCKLDSNKVQYARITITHVCFIAFTLSRSLEYV